MTATEQILLERNKDLFNENLALIRFMALVLISADHDSAVKAAKEAFANMDAKDPFLPLIEADKTKVEERIAS